jgi:quinoprotein dehydrogenase-associated probable ABC transporter substrate-binding protein
MHAWDDVMTSKCRADFARNVMPGLDPGISTDAGIHGDRRVAPHSPSRDDVPKQKHALPHLDVFDARPGDDTTQPARGDFGHFVRRDFALHRRRACYLAAVFGLLLAPRAAAQAPGLGASVELVDPKVFRVCADPHNLPLSNEQGAGFENKLAELFATKLNESTDYTYFPQVIGFIRNTLNALRCDVVMGTAVGDPMVQTTNPYYRTTYALLFKPNNGLDGVDSLGDARLKDKHIGIVAGTPPATILTRDGLMALAKPYPLTVDTRETSSPEMMANDIASGTIDAGVLWGPMAGYFAKQTTPHLTVVPLLKDGERLDFRIAMGVRRTDQDWKRKLNKLIAESQPEIDKILTDYGVPLLDEQGQLKAQ